MRVKLSILNTSIRVPDDAPPPQKTRLLGGTVCANKGASVILPVVFSDADQFLPIQHCMVVGMALRLFVCPSVCLSQTSIVSKWLNGSSLSVIVRDGFRHVQHVRPNRGPHMGPPLLTL